MNARLYPRCIRSLLTVICLCSAFGCKQHTLYEPAAPPAPPQKPAYADRHYQDMRPQPPGPRTDKRRPVIALMRTGEARDLSSALHTPASQSAAGLQTGDLPVLMPPQARQFLMRSLLTSGDFIVLERERILQLIAEIDLGRSPYVAKGTAPAIGKLIGVHYIVEAACLSPAMGGDEAARAEYSQWASLFSDGELPRGQHAVFLDVYHVETGQVVGVAFGAHQSLPVATRIAVDDLRQRIANEPPPVKVMGLERQRDKVLLVLDIGSEEQVQRGDRFSAAGASPDLPATVIEASEVHPLYCIAQVVSGGENLREKDVVTRLKS